MGLLEQTKAGAVLKRENISFVADVGGTGNVSLGSVYSILSVQTTIPCRLRLYDTQASRDDGTETSRAFGDLNVPNNISLIGDFSMSLAGAYAIDPMLYGVSDNVSTRLVYYRVDPAGITPTITLKRFLLDDRNIVPNVLTPYDVDNRRTLPVISDELEPLELSSGSLINPQIPTTYLLISASLTASGQIARLRLYNNSSSINDVSEKARPFATEPAQSIGLITDLVLTSSAGITYFNPKIVGTNLQNMGTNLQITKTNNQLIAGENELYYILENVNSSGGAVWIGAELNVYSLED